MTNTLQHRAQRFLRWLHDDQAGYIEIVAGATDPERPKKINLLMDTRQWFYLDPERPDLYIRAGVYAAQLADEHSNVYTGIRTYRSKKRAEENTKPGRVIFIDDAPAAPAIPYSASIRTSEASRHAYYKCAQDVTKDDARRAQAALGGDPSGVDLTQLVRFPGTFNTKNNGRWSVEPEATTGAIYNVADLRSAWPAVECSPKGEITPLAMPAVEKHLANIDELLTCSRSQLIKPDTQTGRILSGEMLSFAAKGKMDDSRSMNACAVGLGLLLRGYMDDEIAAVIFHLYRKWGMERDKGTEWCKADIGRILAYAHTQHPEAKQSPTRYRQQAQGITIVSRPAASRARADRPTKFDPPMLFARYQAQPELCDQRRKARAAALGISTATLDRLEDGLEAIGLIEIHAKPGMPGHVILLGGVINIPSPEVLSDPIEAPAPEVEIENAQSEQNADRSPQCKGETHPPLVLPGPVAPPALLDAIGEALDALPGERVNGKTGELQPWPRTNKRVLGWLEANYPEMWSQWERYAPRKIARVRKMRRSAVFNEIRDMPTKALDQAHAQCARTISKFEKRAALETDAKIRADWEREANKRRGRLALLGQERAAREQTEAKRIQLIGYSLTEQAEMLDLVDQVRPKRQKIGRAAPVRGVCSPPPCGPQAGAAGLLTALFARQGRQYDPAEYRQQVQP